MGNEPYRVRYAEGQRLRAADLTSEQEYLIAFERRHNLSQHAPGIVHGLDLHRDWRDLSAMRAGAAVDDDGTLLVLEATSSVDGEAQECLDSWLIRCETPFRLSHPGRARCEFDRVQEEVRVVTIPVAASADPVPPFAGAVYLGRSVCADLRDRAYTTIAASTAGDPAQRALLQVGPATGRDRIGFVLSTIDEKRVLTPRITLDRLGTNRFRGNVTLAGYRASASIALTETQMLLIRARRPGVTGEQIHVRARPNNDDPGHPKLRVQFFDGMRRSEPDLLVPKEAIEQAVKAFESDLVTVALARVPNRFVIARPIVLFRREDRIIVDGEEPQPEPDPFTIPSDVTLKTRGGMLALSAYPATTANDSVRGRGCYERSPADDEIGKGANGLKFFAMSEAPKAPPVPGAWSVETGTPAEPSQEMRLNLGEKKDGDLSIRFSLGNVGPDDTYGDWLNINGNCVMTMPDVEVEGTIEFAPIKPDHTDKNFTNLLVRAWMEGLQAAVEASTVVDVAFTGLPALIKTDEAWNYSVQITNNTTPGQQITADRVLETRTITGLPAPLTKVISQQITIDPGQQESIPVSHPAGETPAGMMSIEIRVSGKIGNAAWWRARTTGTDIPVVESPSIDAAGIPDSVPRGLPWTYSFDVRNNSLTTVTVQTVSVAEGANPPQPLGGTPVNLPGQASTTFNPPQHAGMNNNLPLTVTADFLWPADGSTSSIDQHRTVRMRNDVSARIVETEEPGVNTAWEYDLELTNVSTRGLTLKSLTQHIESVAGDFPPTGPEAVAFAPDLSIDPDTTELTVDGPLVPAATAEIELILDIEYERNDDGRTFTIRQDRRFDVS